MKSIVSHIGTPAGKPSWRRVAPLAAWTVAAVLLLVLAPAPARGLVASVTKTRDLQFGTFVSLGSSGTVRVSASGVRSSTGGVRLLNRGTVAAASFTASGTPNSRYTITLPANNAVVMSYQGKTLVLTNFTCSAPLTGRFSGNSLAFTVGATATVGPAPTPGSYSGTFNVTVN